MAREDTLDDSRQGHEDALLAMIDAGMIPRMSSVADHSALADEPKGTTICYRVPRDIAVAEHGYSFGLALRDIPVHHHGNVVISFDGWGDDPRPLAFIPDVVHFCASALLGPHLNDVEHANAVLDVLLDECMLPGAFTHTVTGGLWLVSHVWARLCYTRTDRSQTGYAQIAVFSTWLRKSLRDGCVAPDAGVCAR